MSMHISSNTVVMRPTLNKTLPLRQAVKTFTVYCKRARIYVRKSSVGTHALKPK